jgi:hypothetical protein
MLRKIKTLSALGALAIMTACGGGSGGGAPGGVTGIANPSEYTLPSAVSAVPPQN